MKELYRKGVANHPDHDPARAVVRPHLKHGTGHMQAGYSEVVSSEIANPGCRRRHGVRKATRGVRKRECIAARRSRRPPACLARARTERPVVVRGRQDTDGGEKAMSYKAQMSGGGESYSGVVP